MGGILALFDARVSKSERRARAESLFAAAPYRSSHRRLIVEAEDFVLFAGASHPDGIDASIHEDEELCVAFTGRLDAIVGMPIEALNPAGAVAEGYRRFKDALFDRLRGDYAFALVRRIDSQAWLTRDFFGVKPLFYVKEEDALIAASDVEQLLPLRSRWELCADGILDGLTMDVRSPESTSFRDILRLPARNQLRRRGRSTWVESIPVRSSPANSTGDFAGLQAAWEQAVQRRLDRDRSTAAQLSGGIDSSTVVVTAHARLGTSGPRLLPIAGRFEGLACDEGPYIDAVESHAGIEVHRYDASGFRETDLDASLIGTPWQEPFRGMNGRGFALAAALGAHVMLSGVGGDELFWEHALFAELVEQRRWLAWNAELFGVLRRPSAERRRWLERALRESALQLAPDWLRRARSVIRNKTETSPPWLGERLTPLWRARLQSRATTRSPEPAGEATWRALTAPGRQLRLELIELEASRAGMELRFPYLDRDLVDSVFALPMSLRRPRGIYKRLLRELAGSRLPELIRERRNITEFSSNLEHAFKDARPRLREVLDRPWRSEAWCQRRGISDLLETLDRAFDASAFMSVWDATRLELWLEALSARGLASPTHKG